MRATVLLANGGLHAVLSFGRHQEQGRGLGGQEDCPAVPVHMGASPFSMRVPASGPHHFPNAPLLGLRAQANSNSQEDTASCLVPQGGLNLNVVPPLGCENSNEAAPGP